MSTEYSFNDFLTYLLIYGANVDAEYKANEIEHIVHFYGDESFLKMSDVYDAHTDAESIEFLQELRTHFTHVDNFHQKVKDALVEVFKSDGEFSDIEKASLHILEDLLK